jgi:hypothetical protein
MHRLLVLSLVVACGGRGEPPASRPAPPRPRFSAAPGDIAFVHASVVTMHGDEILRDRVVVVRGSQIVSVSPRDGVTMPEGVTQIDAHGGYLLPGLADMHVHINGSEDLTLFIAAGVTTVRNMAGSPLIISGRAQIERGEVFGPTIVTAGPIVDGDPPIWPGSTVLTNEADAERVVVEQQKAGYDFIKVYSKLPAPAYRALASAAKQHQMSFAGHVPTSIPLREALSSGQRSIEHLEGYLPALLKDGVTPGRMGSLIKLIVFLAENVDDKKLPAVVRDTAASSTWNCPTLVIRDRLGRMDDPAALARSVRWAEYVSSWRRARWDPKADFRLASNTPADFVAFRKATLVHDRIVAALYAAGAKLLVGTDVGNPFTVAGASLHDELELFVHAGVPRAATLRAATAGAAEFLGRPGAFGVIAPGARADIVLSSTNPLEGPIAIPPSGVMLRGTWLDQARLQAALDGLLAPPRSAD